MASSSGNDKKTHVKTVVKQSMKHWLFILGLDDWHIGLSWDTRDQRAYAENYVGSEYQDMKLGFNLDKLAPMSDRFIQETVVHELLHAIVGQLGALATGKRVPIKLVTWFEENTVTKLTTAFMKLADMIGSKAA